MTILLRDVTNVTRSDSYPYSLELTKDGSKVWILRFETDNEVYGWIDSIYDRCPSMGGVSHPTGFSHRVHVGFDPVTGGFVGLPVEWERLLKGSALTKEDMQRNPTAVVEVLQFYSDKLAPRAQAPETYPSLTPTPPVDAGREKQLGFSAGNSVAPPRPQPPQFQRQDSYNRSQSSTPPQQMPREADGYNAPKRVDMAPQFDDRRRDEKPYDDIPKQKVPAAKQELGGFGGDNRYNASRPAPPAPQANKSSSSSSALPIRQLQAQRPAPTPPNQQKVSPQKPQQQPNGSTYTSKPANGTPQPLTRKPSGSQQSKQQSPGVKPLNIATKQPTGTPKEHHKQTEAALTKKDEKAKEVRMSAMSDAQVMERLRSVVSLSNPLESYNKQKKIGQGASGSVYVARIRENAPSKTAQDIMRQFGPRAQVAIKQMDLRSQPRKELIVNEIIVMKESRHDNIVNFLDAFLQEDTFELWLVLEFMEGGALTDVIDNNPVITEDQIATICLEVI